MRFLVVVAIATNVLAIPGYTLAKGGYVRAPEPVPIAAASMVPKLPKVSIPSPKRLLGGCGRGAIRDPQTHKCRGPGDISN
jgi:hypothetical protein